MIIYIYNTYILIYILNNGVYPQCYWRFALTVVGSCLFPAIPWWIPARGVYPLVN